MMVEFKREMGPGNAPSCVTRYVKFRLGSGRA